MENNYHQNDEIEQFLRDELSEQKMYPSEYIWENIRTEIHGNRAWPALTFIALFIIIAVTISTIYNYPPKKIIANTNYSFVPKASPANKAGTAISTDAGNIIIADESLQTQMDPNSYTAKTFAVINNSGIVTTISSTPATSQPIIMNDVVAVAKQSSVIVPAKQIRNNPVLFNDNKNFSSVDNAPTITHDELTANAIINNTESAAATKVTKNKSRNRKALSLAAASVNHDDDNPVEDAYLKDFGYEAVKNKKQASRWEMQFYVTPSISYRKLEDDKVRLNYSPSVATSSIASVPPLALNSSASSVDNAVHHTPALGMELGAAVLYNITPSFKFKTGLQFNIRQYYIDASQSFGIATIAIVQNNHLDSVNIYSTLSNSTNGFNTTKIDTRLYQISIPIGFQLDLIHGKRLGISAGASVQPTFTLNKNVYMISTDYKYYANGAPFFRKWNFNTSVDLNITYNTGNLKWSFGPQIRYQHLPTYNDIYPIKEYRWDYGLKIGVTLPINK